MTETENVLNEIWKNFGQFSTSSPKYVTLFMCDFIRNKVEASMINGRKSTK